MNYLKPFWSRLFSFNWKFGLALILIFGILRFLIVLKANATGNYNFTSIIFLFMWLAPFVLLNRSGRAAIGIRKVQNWFWAGLSVVLGALLCGLVYLLGDWFYGLDLSNWLVYISKTYSASLPPDFAVNKHIFSGVLPL